MNNVWTPALVLSHLTAHFTDDFYKSLGTIFGDDNRRDINDAYQVALYDGTRHELDNGGVFYDEELKAMADRANALDIPVPAPVDLYQQSHIRGLDKASNALRLQLGQARISSATIDAAQKVAHRALNDWAERKEAGDKAFHVLGQLVATEYRPR